jgi:2-succinyl-5-enolpyruvyl-6-hydroxy-3-cyclohexene-1-carboxylate synthase
MSNQIKENLFKNTNTAWSAGVVETMVQCGVKNAILSPGSRSSPLVYALAANDLIDSVPILDERSAGFFALGIAKRTQKPVVLVCTSGSATANYLPAVVEASMSRVPLILLTADRPHELRDCFAGQAIDQNQIYGNYVRSYIELSLPSCDLKLLKYMRNSIRNMVSSSVSNIPGPVHINVPFREPLLPTEDQEVLLKPKLFKKIFQVSIPSPLNQFVENSISDYSSFFNFKNGVIILGNNHGEEALRLLKIVLELSDKTAWPILADATSSCRNFGNESSSVIWAYDYALRNYNFYNLEFVLLIGELPTSKVLRSWIEKENPDFGIVSQESENRDPLHVNSFPVSLKKLERDVKQFSAKKDKCSWNFQFLSIQKKWEEYLQIQFEKSVNIFEGFIIRSLLPYMERGSQLMFASSMPVRDGEFFLPNNKTSAQVFANRGANGIDGNVSTAIGLSHNAKVTYLLCGDLAFLHDTNALMSARILEGQLTILLVNNDGGAIFENLAVSSMEDLFEEYFATPQSVQFEPLISSYKDCSYCRVETKESLQRQLNIPSKHKVRIIEVVTDRKRDTAYRKLLLNQSL